MTKSTPSLRITGGELRGRKVALPRAHELRPTSERGRQAFFNIVQHEMEGARFLDLFAGTAVFSFEALSRGASRATAVESAKPAAAAIEASARTFGVEVRVICRDALEALRAFDAAEAFTVVYADPPYLYPAYDELLSLLDRSAALSPGAVVAIEHVSGASPFSVAPERLRFRKEVRHGTVAIAIFDLPAITE